MEIFGYTFHDESLLEIALTTPSFRMDTPSARDNQRLEFLGDSVLGLLSAESLYANDPQEKEGQLTIKRSAMVSTPALCDVAVRFGIAERLRRNKHAEALTSKSKTLADAVEAIIGAVYLDGGLEAARRVFRALELSSHAESGAWRVNPKGDLQIKAQALKPPQHPRYELLATAGKAHAPIFTVKVIVDGIGEAVASAHCRKEADMQAAAELLTHFPDGK